jgi:hypothetical protein
MSASGNRWHLAPHVLRKNRPASKGVLFDHCRGCALRRFRRLYKTSST